MQGYYTDFSFVLIVYTSAKEDVMTKLLNHFSKKAFLAAMAFVSVAGLSASTPPISAPAVLAASTPPISAPAVLSVDTPPISAPVKVL